MNILAIYEHDGNYIGGIWPSWEAYYTETFSPDCETVFCYDFTTKGKSYKDRKEYVRNFAVDWSNVLGMMSNDFSYGEWLIVNSEFERLGRQYGLLKEFETNCIC